jgi:Tfp pilus assembly protein PilN
MRAVNLLPRDAERTSAGDRRLPFVVAGGGIVAVTALFALLFLSASGAVDEKRAALALTESAIAAVPDSEGSPELSGVVVQERADRVAALSAALSSRIPVDRALYELSYVLPDGVWLTGLIANAPSAAEPGAPPGGGPAQSSSGPAGVTIQGATFSHEAVARVLARLAVLPSLENVRLTASALIQPQADPSGDGQAKAREKKRRALVTFTVEADLRSGGSQ